MDFRVVLVGCGKMAKAWLDYALARADCKVVALVDIQASQAEKMRQEHNLHCPTYTQLEPAILENHANLVFDVTVPEAHEQVVLTALRLGCAVFGEKPLSTSLGSAQRMVAASLDTGRLYGVMQNRRYNRHMTAFRHLLAQIGDLGQLSASFFLAPHFGGFREAMQSPLLLDMAIHTFDQARFLSEADALSVYCHEHNPKGSWFAGKAAAVCIFEMSNNSLFTYNGSWCAEGLQTSWDAEWRASGSKGSAVWDGTNPPHGAVLTNPNQAGFLRSTQNISAAAPEPMTEGHAGCLDELFYALEHGATPQTACGDNIKSLQMVLAALESAKLGSKVTIGH